MAPAPPFHAWGQPPRVAVSRPWADPASARKILRERAWFRHSRPAAGVACREPVTPGLGPVAVVHQAIERFGHRHGRVGIVMPHPPEIQAEQRADEAAHGHFPTQFIGVIEVLFAVVLAYLDEQDVFQVGEDNPLRRAVEKRGGQRGMPLGCVE